MNEPRDTDETLDAGPTDVDQNSPPTVDLGPLSGDSLEVGLAAAFGKYPGPPRSSLGPMRPVVLKEADGESSLVVTPGPTPYRRRPRRATATSSPARSPAEAWAPCSGDATSTSAAIWP